MSPQGDGARSSGGGVRYGAIKIQRMDEAEQGREAVARKRTNRRILYTGVGVSVLLAVALLAAALMRRGPAATSVRSAGSAKSPEDIARVAMARLNELTQGSMSANSKTNDTSSASASNIGSGCEVHVVLMRHCEKEDPLVENEDEDHSDQHCSYAGYNRAEFLPTLFGPGNRWPVPDRLYAYSATRHKHSNYREIETIIPLADKYDLSINSEFHGKGKLLAEDIFKAMSSGTCGSTTLICWKHSHMADLAQHLGCMGCPKEYPEDSFDQVWQLRYVFDVANLSVPLAMVGGVQRRLHKHHHHHKKEAPEELEPEKPKVWSLYPTVTAQNFDPLQQSWQKVSGAVEPPQPPSGGNEDL